MAYSFIGIQTLYLATAFDPIYWNSACLIVNSGSIDPELKGTTDYSKIASALGDILSRGIKVSLVDINKSDFSFAPDLSEGTILYGLKALSKVGDDIVTQIIENRPYTSMWDFYNKVHPSKTAMVSLIKGGAFDSMMERKQAMAEYLWLTCDKKNNLTLSNMNTLIKNGLIPNSLKFQRSVFEFNRYLKKECKVFELDYELDNRAMNFLNKNFTFEVGTTLPIKAWEKIYSTEMDKVREWMRSNAKEVLWELNKKIFAADWEKYAKGSYSAWEMEAMCFYYHEHELAGVRTEKYGIQNFFDLPEEPIVEKLIPKKDYNIPIYRLNKIIGTCISKDKNRASIDLLTPEGVVTVKFRKEYFAMFNKRISQRGADGIKHTIEQGWFERGTMLMLQGIRRGDDFIPKKYSASGGHELYKILSNNNGLLDIQVERFEGDGEEEES